MTKKSNTLPDLFYQAKLIIPLLREMSAEVTRECHQKHQSVFVSELQTTAWRPRGWVLPRISLCTQERKT